MFYQPENGHGLPYNPYKAIITPRPIAWIATRDIDGRPNLSPYSFFNGTADSPPQVMFANNGTKADQDFGKDTLANIKATGEFCISIVSSALRDAMNASCAPSAKDVDEFQLAGLTPTNCKTIESPRVAEAPASLECKLNQIVTLEGDHNHLVLGTVTGIHIQDDLLNDGQLDLSRYQPLARLGYKDYTIVDNIFSLERPTA